VSAGSTINRQPGWLRVLTVVTAACLVAGTLARFWELGKWPLAIDEYYFARSVQNLLHFGIPKFPCGGLYVRGLLLQYVCAALQSIGVTAELAPRLLAALSSVLTLPATYLIGRRLGGRATGLIAVAILSLSVWEIEIGRFGRMYAPFQAVFTWYAVCFLSYVVDGRRRALAPMIILSVVGFAVWEGGLFLVLTNFLPPFIAHPDGRLSRRDWVYLIGCSGLLIPAYFLTLADLRTAWSPPVFPPDYVEPPDTPSPSRLDAAVMPWTVLSAHRSWLFAALLPLGLTALGLVRFWRNQPSPLAGLAILLVALAAALHQFLLVAGLLVILILLGTVGLRDLTGTPARTLRIALVVWVTFWIAFGLLHTDWHVEGLSKSKAVLLLGYEFVRFPDLLREVALPWARTVPLLFLGLFFLATVCVTRGCLHHGDTIPAERVLLTLFVILLLAAGASNPPRHETRYVFFLYPLAIVFCILTVERALRLLPGLTSVAPAMAAVTALTLFGLSEDFRPAHLWNIDTEAVNFRIGMGGRLAGHYHPRSDTRAAAVWLQNHAQPARDIVVISFPGVDFYYPAGNFYFVADTDPRFDVWTCSSGTIQRWSNLSMIHSFAALGSQITSGRKVWMVIEMSRMAEIVAGLPPAVGPPHLEWKSRAGDIGILTFPAKSIAVQSARESGQS
jgi:hypothetical protein